jgi:tRNA-dihydrouridine synthase C
MIGRGAIRHPWIFERLRAVLEGRETARPRSRDLLAYIRDLYDLTAAFQDRFDPAKHVQKMKRYLGFIAAGTDRDFDFQIRRVATPEEFDAVCRHFLDHDGTLSETPPGDSAVFCGFGELTSAA